MSKVGKIFFIVAFIPSLAKTLKSTPQNIIFYQKNNFNLLCSSFGRAYLLFKI